MTTKMGDNCTTNFEMNSLRLFLFGLELMANILLLFLTLLFALLLKRTKTLDRNSKVLLANHQLAAFNIAWTRFILIPQMLVENGLFSPLLIVPIQWLHDVSINVNTFIQIAITFECMLSTFWPVLHEQMGASRCLSAFIFAWPWAFTLFLYIIEQLKYMETVPQFLVLEALNLISWMIFCLLHVANRRKYKQISAGDLSGKYKVIVNIRTVRTLNFIAALSVLRNLITMSLLIIIIQYLKPMCNYYGYLISSHSYDLTVSFYNLLLLLPLVLTHEEFGRNFRKIFGLNNSKAAVTNVKSGANPKWAQHNNNNNNMLVVRNVLGENLARDSGDYFRQLAASWGGPGGTTSGGGGGGGQQPNGGGSQQRAFGGRAVSRVKAAGWAVVGTGQSSQGKSNWTDGLLAPVTVIGGGIGTESRRNSRMVEVDIPSRLTS